jgi:hypothetical protein
MKWNIAVSEGLMYFLRKMEDFYCYEIFKFKEKFKFKQKNIFLRLKIPHPIKFQEVPNKN